MDELCRLLSRCDGSSQAIAVEAINEYLADPYDETLDAAMRRVVTAAERCGVGRTSVNTSLLEHSFRRLCGQDEQTWAMLLSIRGFHYAEDVYAQLFALSPFAGKTFLVVEDHEGEMRIRGGIFAPQLVQRVIDTREGRSTRNKQFCVILSDVPWDNIAVYVDPTVTAETPA